MIKQNPIPAALIGLGLGWLYFNRSKETQYTGGTYRQRPYSYDERGYDERGYDARGYRATDYRSGYADNQSVGGYSSTEPSRSGVRDAVDTVQEKAGNAVERVGDAVSSAKDAAGDALHTARNAASDAVHTVRERAGDMAESVVGTTYNAGSSVANLIAANPLPAALAGLSLGWLYMSSQNQSRAQNRPVESWARNYETSGGSRSGGYYPSTSSQPHELPSEQVRRERGGDLPASIGASRYGSSGYATSTGYTSGTSSYSENGSNGSGGLQANIQANPLVFGAIALGFGAALGLLMPETEAENRVMGETRDKLMDAAKETAEDIKMRAQIVAEEAKDTLGEAIGSVKQEAKTQAKGIIGES